MKRGSRWFLILSMCGLLGQVQAITWRDWWETPDQQAKTLMDSGHYSEAEQTFQRLDWRATAAYRAGDYQHAAQNYSALRTSDGYYNAGNALANAGRYQEAIAAYNQSLQRDPKHADALFNKKIVEKLLEEQKKSQSNDKQQQQQQQQQQSSANEKNAEKNQNQLRKMHRLTSKKKTHSQLKKHSNPYRSLNERNNKRKNNGYV